MLARQKNMNSQGFTLVELLVVISIIALLLSILMPSLSKAREMAKKVVCLNNFKTVGTAMLLYTQDNSNYFPSCYTPPATGAGLTNEQRYSNVWWAQKLLPYVGKNVKAILCASNRNPDERFNFYYEYAAVAVADYGKPTDAKIGYNHTFLSCSKIHNWCQTGNSKYAKIRKTVDIKHPSETIAIVGTKTWAATFFPNDPKLFNNNYNNHAHSGGTNVGYVDTHAEWIAESKQEMFEDRRYWTGGVNVSDR